MRGAELQLAGLELALMLGEDFLQAALGATAQLILRYYIRSLLYIYPVNYAMFFENLSHHFIPHRHVLSVESLNCFSFSAPRPRHRTGGWATNDG
jgi:hypothetical protein